MKKAFYLFALESIKCISIFSFLFFLTVSCKQGNKYVYKERAKNNGYYFESKNEALEAENDSIAYLKGFEKFFISEYVYENMKERLPLASNKPIDFKILNSDSIDIVPAYKYLYPHIEDSIKQRIVDLKHNFDF
tara:strand:- start:3417 stop:3818 length:402 start_codon:yes stop_codon:yes gene_type:complete